ncbi:MAG: patatin-like phospholipase family protein [Rhodanobacteraceae bacterium]|nr:patatin-like phospholipase family protein [Rhodanobacteraceae bacterium]HPF73014.1 patatin-like phospholipase family protein [Xanthomonadaceae bacterium]
MLLIQPARSHQRSACRIGLAVAGGGPIGGMYELGALRALERAIVGLRLSDLDVYVGVSSGAFLAAGLANRMSASDMCRVFLAAGDRPEEVRFRPEAFLRPAFAEYVRRAAGLPHVLLNWWLELFKHPSDVRISELVGRLGELVPTGLFDNEAIEEFLRESFSQRGRSNDFRELGRKLFVVAVELDSGDTVRFGSEGWDDVPISQAIQASSALPGLYTPVEIRGRHFVDGALRRTMHASVALDQGIDLLIGINPLVPFDAKGDRVGEMPERLARGGLPAVLSQTVRAMLQSRVEVGLAKYAQRYPDTDQLVVEPNADDAEMFFTNVFSYSSRQRVSEHAYAVTLADLGQRREQLAPLLARHGLRLDEQVLDHPEPCMMDSLEPPPRGSTDGTARLRRALDDLDAHLRAIATS